MKAKNPTVGIVLCAQKDKSIVRYSVLHGNEQLFATKYKLVLPSEEELRAELVREQRFIDETLHLRKSVDETSEDDPQISQIRTDLQTDGKT